MLSTSNISLLISGNNSKRTSSVPSCEDEPLRKPIPVHDQTVKDEKGRYKRFHGAFTGGFSAGYFNTVGTKEGQARRLSRTVNYVFFDLIYFS